MTGAQNGMYGRRGEEGPNWKGGCTPDRQAFYTSEEWATAVLAVWKRDKAECVRCHVGAAESMLHIHHIVSFAVKELRADPDNLVLLCRKCHRFIHSRKNATHEFIVERG